MLNKLLSHRLLLILALAAFLRLFLLARVPPSLNWDEISMGYTAYSIGETGMDEWGEKLPLFFRSYGEWKSAVYIYLLVPFIKVFGLNAWGVRLPSALSGILAVWLTYLIGSKLYSRRVGLWAALFLTISPWHLMLTRPAFEAGVSLTLVLAGIHFFLKAAHTKYHIRYTIYSALAFGLAPHTYNSAKVIVPFLVIWLIWQTKMYRHLRRLALFLLILAVFAAPLVVNMLTGRSQFRYTQVGVTTDEYGLTQFIDFRKSLSDFPPIIAKLAFNRGTFALHNIANNWLTYFSPSFLLVEAGDHNQHHLPLFGVLYLAEFIFFLIGIRFLFSRHRPSIINHQPLKLLPIVIIFLGILPAALTRDQGHVLRSILTLPGWQLLAGLGAVHLQNIKFPYLKIVNWLLVIQVAVFITAYFVWYPRAFARDWQWGHQQAAQFIKEHESAYDHIVMTKWYGEPQLFLAFYNRWDPAWYQEENKKNLRYEQEGKLWLDQLPEYSIGKYTFKYINFALDEREPNTLYIGKFDDFFGDSKYLKTITFPDGEVTFHLVEP